MDDLFDTWFDTSEETNGRKTFWRATENEGQRELLLDEIATRTRSHYASDMEVATFLEVLGYDDAAEVMRTNYPEGATGKSADLGEILCAEIVEEWCEFKVPIRKLRYKDHRDQAMRGEDVIGIRHDAQGRLCLLKGEAKSARSLSSGTVEEARDGLNKNLGRPTAHSMMYLARRLIEQRGASEELGKEILAEAAQKAVPQTRITHCFFAITGNKAGDMLDEDYVNAGSERDQYIIHIRIPEHGAFVAEVYEKVIDIALD
ncbi:MAG: Hachiman antiphage defense system protein HamA [Paracoccaceae bacterium]